MKKTALLAVLVLFFAISSSAQIVVLQDGKTITYEPKAELSIAGKTTSRVLYEGVLITIPRGQKVHIKKRDGKILISGTNLRNVEIAGKNISSNGHVIISVSPDNMKVTTLKGDSTITRNGFLTNRVNKTENKNKKNIKPNSSKFENKGKKYLRQYSYYEEDEEQEEEENLLEISDYINEVSAQQSAQDVMDSADLSQSSPRS